MKPLIITTAIKAIPPYPIYWALIFISLFYGYGIYHFLDSNPWFGHHPLFQVTVGRLLPISLAGIGLGFLILFLHVLRQRLIARKTDRYRDIQE